MALTVVVGVAFELLAIRPRKDGDPLALIIITIGGSMLIRSLARHVFGRRRAAAPAVHAGPSLGFLGAVVERQALWIWGLTLVGVVGLWFLYNRTRLGARCARAPWTGTLRVSWASTRVRS